MDTVDVEEAVDKALEQAVDELREALVAIGEEARHGDASFWDVEKQFSMVIVVFARQMLAVLLSRKSSPEPATRVAPCVIY